MAKKSKKKKFSLVLAVIVIIAALAGAFIGIHVYKAIVDPVVKKDVEFYLKEITSFSDLAEKLVDQDIINNQPEFYLVARIKKFDRAVLPGRYIIKKDMSNNDIINLFRSGNQTPVKLTFNNIRTREELAGVLSHQLLADSLSFLNLFRNEAFVQDQGFTIHTALCPFIPNTYEIYWNAPPVKVYERMLAEYKKFWTTERLQKADKAGLSPLEVCILASIVDEETAVNNEKSMVAGLYINRLKRGIPLQADPTLRYALHDFSIKRILNEYKSVDSPYNTYKYKGLPPGPIRIPERFTLDAVLNYTKHGYIYMCAKPDFSGSHNFAKTLSEHNRNAKNYHNALNKRKIYK